MHTTAIVLYKLLVLVVCLLVGRSYQVLDAYAYIRFSCDQVVGVYLLVLYTPTSAILS